MSRLCASIFFGLVFSVCLQAQQLNPTDLSVKFSKVNIPSLKGEIELDGELDDPLWAAANTFELEYVTYPFENTQPPVKTRVTVFENGEIFYIAFFAEDPSPTDIRAFYRDRDDIWSDDLVGIKLDTFNDNRLAYEFFVNPLGIQADAIQNEMTGDESDSWDGIWRSAGKIVENGYQVEMAIPLRMLNFEESDNRKTWGAEFVRFLPREDRLRISNMPVDRNNACDLCQMGEINGFSDARQGKNLALIPTLVVGKTETRDPEAGENWQSERNQELGLDLKWGITPEVFLQATLNPDFSQVEADAAQLSINNTFALFFDEKRTFFLENADYFSSQYDLVYTRNIAAPDYGVKATGRVDQHTFGVFVANDENTTFLVPGNLGSSIAQIEEESVNLALRYRYDLSNDLSVGWTGTLRDAENYHNYVNALDLKYQLTEKDTLRAQLVQSDTEYPFDLYTDFCDGQCELEDDYSETALRVKKSDSFTGKAYRIDYEHAERDWYFDASHNYRGKNIRTDLGFGSWADRSQTVIGGGYYWYSEKEWWNKIRVYGDWDISHNNNGELIEKEAELYVGVNGQMQSYFQFGVLKRNKVGLRANPNDLSIDGNATMFSEKMASVYMEARPTSNLYFESYFRVGDALDYDNNRLGKEVLVEPYINFGLGLHLQLDLSHTYKKLDVENKPLFTANLSDLRVTYQFDQRQFLRLTLLYSDIERNQDNYTFDVDATRRSLGTQLLYSYKINPLTKVFVGYSDAAYENDALSALTKDERSVFMKLSYAWLN